MDKTFLSQCNANFGPFLSSSPYLSIRMARLRNADISVAPPIGFVELNNLCLRIPPGTRTPKFRSTVGVFFLSD